MTHSSAAFGAGRTGWFQPMYSDSLQVIAYLEFAHRKISKCTWHAGLYLYWNSAISDNLFIYGTFLRKSPLSHSLSAAISSSSLFEVGMDTHFSFNPGEIEEQIVR